MKLKKIFLGAGATLGAVTLVGCGNGGSEKYIDEIKVCLASTPKDVDPALNMAVDGASYDVHAFSGLVRYEPDGKGGLKLGADLAKSLPAATPEDGGKVKYTFKLKDNIKFSNGEEITAQDFVDSWNRASSASLAAEYGYMFDIIDRIDDETLNIKATDDKTLEVVLPVDVPYFYEICAFPAAYVLYDAKHLDSEGAWAKDPQTCVTSGAYTMESYRDNVDLVLTKNDNYWDAKNITMKKIDFVFSDDESATYAQYLTGDLHLIDTIDTATVRAERNKSQYHEQGQLGTYFICWNIDDNLFGSFTQAQQEEIRTAISLLIDRKNIVENITQLGETPSTGYVGAGLSDPKGGEFVDHNGPNEDGKGWTGNANDYDGNVAAARAILDKYFTKDSKGKYTDFPSINYLFNTGEGHQSIATEIKQELANFGITLNISNEQWSTFISTRNSGNFQVARHGWLADYNDPISFLDMWVSTSGQNAAQLGKGTKASTFTYEIDLSSIAGYTKLEGTWAQTYDVVIADIKAETDTNKRYELMHKAETLLMSTGAITPIYNYMDNWLQASNLVDVYSSPLGYKFFHWSKLKTN